MHPALIAAAFIVEVARGEAVRGEWKANDSDFRYVDDATVDLAGDGDVVVAWVDQAKRDVFVQRYGKTGQKRFAAAINVSKNGATFSWLPRVVVDRKDPNDVAILWQEIIFSGGSHGGETLFARSTDGGRTFGAPVNLSNSAAGDGKGRLSEKEWHNGSHALVRSGADLYATWTEYEGALWLRRSTDHGKTFAPALHVGGTKEAPARAPTLAVAGDKVYLAWAVGENPKADLQLATSNDGGKTFSAPRALFANDARADAPRLAIDDKGAVHLVYAENGAILYSKNFAAPRELGQGAHFPNLAIDNAGAIHVAWDHFTGDNAYATGLMLATSRDGGATFAAAQPVFSAPSKALYGSQQGLSIKLAARDGLAFVNSTFRRGDASWITLLRR